MDCLELLMKLCSRMFFLAAVLTLLVGGVDLLFVMQAPQDVLSQCQPGCEMASVVIEITGLVTVLSLFGWGVSRYILYRRFRREDRERREEREYRRAFAITRRDLTEVDCY